MITRLNIRSDTGYQTEYTITTLDIRPDTGYLAGDMIRYVMQFIQHIDDMNFPLHVD